MAISESSGPQAEHNGVNHWVLVGAVTVAMPAIAHFCYAGTPFTTVPSPVPYASLSVIQVVAILALLLAETRLVPDCMTDVTIRLFSRAVITVIGMLIGVGWVATGPATATGGIF